MTNPFYNASGNPGDRAPGSSQTMRAEFVSIQQGFDKLPTSLSPNTVVVVNPGGTALTTTAYALALGGALTLAGAFTTTGPYSTTLAQQANTTLTLPASNATLATLALAETLTNKTLTAPVLNTPTVNNGTFNSPTLVTPQLGTPTSGNLSNCTALPISTGVSGLAAGVATFLGTPSSANLLAAMTDETGTGPLVFGTSPTLNTPTLNSPSLVTPNLGTPSAGNLANCTNLPINGGTTGTLAVNRGGTGTGTAYAAGGVIFAGASGVYTADGALSWNNTDKTLGVGTGAPAGASWRALIKSFGVGTFPLVIQNASGSATGFYVSEDANGDFAAVVTDRANAVNVRLHSRAPSYFLGGTLSVGTTSGTSWLGVMGPTGTLIPDNLARIGSNAYGRYLRLGVATTNTANQAPFIQSNYNGIDTNNYVLLLNPQGGNVSVNSNREAAAALDVFGNAAVNDGGYFYTPYNGSTNTGTVRAGIQVDGAAQSLNFVTNNAYRGGVTSGGDLYIGNYFGLGAAPVPGWSSRLQVNGDVTTLQASGGLYMNSYWAGAFYRANAGYPAALRLDGGGLIQLLGGPNGAANTTWSQTQLIGVGLQSGNFGNVAIGSIGIFWPKFDVQGDVNGDVVSRVFNQNSGGSTTARFQLDLTAFAGAAVLFDIRRNNGAPYSIVQNGTSVPLLYLSAPTGVYAQINGTDRLRVEGSAVTALGVPFNTTYTGGNQFGILLLQGDTASGGYVRTQNNTNLYLGANNANYLSVWSGGQYFYPLNDYFTELGAVGNRWSIVHSIEYRTYGTTSGYTRLLAQGAAANNAVLLPPYNGTLLIGGTQLSANLGGDVPLNNTSTYFNGPSIALPAGGTWFVTTGITLQDYNSAANFEARLIEGSNVYASALTSTWASGAGTTVVLSAFLPGGTTAVVQAIGNSSVFGRILATSLGGGGGQPNATWMRAIRVA